MYYGGIFVFFNIIIIDLFECLISYLNSQGIVHV